MSPFSARPVRRMTYGGLDERGSPQPAADLQPVEDGHVPVEQHEPGRIGLLEHAPRRAAVGHDQRVVAPLGDHRGEQDARGAVVVGDEDVHARTRSTGSAASAGPARCTCPGPGWTHRSVTFASSWGSIGLDT